MSEMRYDDQVAIITGAGAGIGREHALMFASRGAKVVVNDLGGATDGGDAGSATPADKVVAEIIAAGGEAVANYDSVTDGHKVVKTAIDTWGRIDILVNNAGILRDKSFAKMSEADWNLIIDVHLNGTMSVTKAAWPHMLEAKYGRIVMTTSAAGIYGNFGQTNYSAAKLGILGFANSLSVEGAAKNITVNTIAPLAASRLTQGLMPDDITSKMGPEFVSPLVACLCHADNKETHSVFEVGAGYISKLRWERTQGHVFDVANSPLTPEAISSKWDKICDFEGSEHIADVTSGMASVISHLSNPSKGGNEFIDLDLALSSEISFENTYDERDLSIYALGVGAAGDPLDPNELAQVYELNSQFSALSTFGAMPAGKALLDAAKGDGFNFPGLNYGFDRVLHGEQLTEIKQVLKPSAKLTHTFFVKDVYDKAPNAVVIMASASKDEYGNEVTYNEQTIFVRGAGGWGGDRGPSSSANELPSRKPDAVVEENVPINQALLYRLSGDWNPLHADPSMAKAFGFDKPILHGMCTYGYVGRHITNSFCDGDPRYLKSIKVRFAESVFPGETLVTSMWKEDGKVVFETRVKERDLVVLQNAVAEIFDELPKEPEIPVEETGEEPATDGVVETVIGEDVFKAIAKHVAANPQLVAEVDTVFQFDLTDPEGQYYLDLKNGEGSCVAGAAAEPDVTIEVSETNMIGIITGEADAQKLFFAGDVAISGNMMASGKMANVFDGLDDSIIEEMRAERVASGGGASAAQDDSVTGQDVFGALANHIAANAQLVAEVDTVFQFVLSDPDSEYYMDLKNGDGVCAAGAAEQPDVTIEVSEENMIGIIIGEADPQKLFFAGDVKISGNMMASSKMEVVFEGLDPNAIEGARKERLASGGAAPAAAPKKKAEPQAPAIFAALGDKIKKDKKINAKIQFNVSDPDASWTVDFIAGSVTENGEEGDVVIELADKALAALAKGTEASTLHQKGELSVVAGDVLLAHKLAFLNGLI